MKYFLQFGVFPHVSIASHMPVVLLKLPMCPCAGSSTVFFTPDDYNYDHVWFQSFQFSGGADPIVFKVKACSDANIVLAEYAGITHAYTYEVTNTSHSALSRAFFCQSSFCARESLFYPLSHITFTGWLTYISNHRYMCCSS